MNGGEPETVGKVTPEAVAAFHLIISDQRGRRWYSRATFPRPDRCCGALPRLLAE